MATLISKVIHPEEIIVRCLLRSYLDKKKKAIDFPAVEPAKGENDLSMLRLTYTEEAFCIHHGQSLAGDSNMSAGT